VSVKAKQPLYRDKNLYFKVFLLKKYIHKIKWQDNVYTDEMIEDDNSDSDTMMLGPAEELYPYDHQPMNLWLT